eukprot:363660-Chlamydomonas_euryale.AAC.1
MDQQLQPLVSAHNAYLRRDTGMGGLPEVTLQPTAQICTAVRAPGCPADAYPQRSAIRTPRPRS